MSRPRWAILIASVSSRADLLARLLNSLEEQIAKAKVQREVEVLALVDNQLMPLDQKRNRLMQMTNAEYVSFIDDDDLPANDYIQSIFPLLDGVDYIGFRMQHYEQGTPSKPTFHSIRYKSWDEDSDGYYRHISHLNPIKRCIARSVPFIGQFGEDYTWGHAIYDSELVQTEHFIDRVMYHYLHDNERTLSK